MSERRDLALALHVLGALEDDERAALARELGEAALAEASRALESLALAESESVVPPPGLAERILDATHPGPGRFEGFARRLTHLFDLPIERVREHLAAIDSAPAAPWRDSGVAGVWLYDLEGGPSVAHADCGLVYNEPGSRFPAHGHTGREQALFLSGQAVTDTGDRWTPGLERSAGPEDRHAYRTEGDEPFVFAIVLDGRFEFE